MPYKDAERQKQAQRDHYAANKDQYKRRYRRTKARHKAWLAEQKDKPCADCGGEFPSVCMDFDHHDPTAKVGDVSALAGRCTWEILKTEVAKCEVVCANCHRIRTANVARGTPDGDRTRILKDEFSRPNH